MPFHHKELRTYAQHPKFIRETVFSFLANHFKNPTASSDTDALLSMQLKKFDAPTNKVFVDELPIGTLFIANNGRVFKKGKLRVKLFECIDTRIATQNKIIEDLKKLKSAISLKMLHSDSWEQFKIQDIASIGRGRVISSVEISQQENPLYPVYSSQTSNDGIMGYLDDFMFEGEYISWTTDGANAGTVFYRNGKFNCTNVCGLLKLKKGFDAHFVSLVLAEATRMYVSTNLANPKLMNNTMGNIQIRLPKLEEQKRISVVFRKLHGLLETHNSLIIKYSKQKQYLLSQMFI